MLQAALDLYPARLRDEIDSLNDWIYPTINNGVYKAGFAQTQVARTRWPYMGVNCVT